uniref:Uncharacterized protein n=1 Tax=Mucochytrium quahogii TaxID=96639 RepID=A0A7S2R657_9STRA|mmetsp:Transcript_7464/g.13524  ORF Transcript_7464/g.13524 Transcript_7464/m.13524 type:complete len:209 (-) Transcript_7464:2005-2631(-)
MAYGEDECDRIGLGELVGKAGKNALQGAKPYFKDVETRIVLRRLVYSVIPNSKATAQLMNEPDLYGPVMLVVTECVILSGNHIGSKLWYFVVCGLYWLLFSLFAKQLAFLLVSLFRQQASSSTPPHRLGNGAVLSCIGYGCFGHCLCLVMPRSLYYVGRLILVSSGSCVALFFYRHLSTIIPYLSAGYFAVTLLLVHSYVFPSFVFPD